MDLLYNRIAIRHWFSPLENRIIELAEQLVVETDGLVVDKSADIALRGMDNTTHEQVALLLR
jgi:hypothetical protein